MGFWLEAIVILTGSKGFTTIVIELEVVGLLEMQAVIEDVSTQVTTSLFTGVYE